MTNHIAEACQPSNGILLKKNLLRCFMWYKQSVLQNNFLRQKKEEKEVVEEEEEEEKERGEPLK